jgi:DNA-binding NtrC family response regulator
LSISPFVRDALAVVHQQSLELIVRGASLDAVLEALCDGIDALDPNVVSSVLVADADGQRLWPKAGISIGTSLPQQQHLQSETERQMIEAAVAVTRGRIAGPKGAASKLGIPRQTLDSKITALGIDKHRYKTR